MINDLTRMLDAGCSDTTALDSFGDPDPLLIFNPFPTLQED